LRQDRPRHDRPGQVPSGQERAPAPEGPEARPPRPERRAEGQGRPDRARGDFGDRRGPQRHGRDGKTDLKRDNGGTRPPERRPERREKAPDPNSPFAKLLALKAQLEGRDPNKG
jgi:ATP-dependent RNA helicase SUPV3L1/SUV3